jgi:hypothetical protein
MNLLKSLIVLVCLFSFIIPNVLAETKNQTLHARIDESLGGVLRLKLEYIVDGALYYPNVVSKGSSNEWRINLKNGRVNIVLTLLGRDYPYSGKLPLGQRVEVPIATGIKLFLYTTVRAPIMVDGRGSTDKGSLVFPYEGSQSFIVKVPEDAVEGETIKISIPAQLNIKAGAKIDLVMIKRDIAEVDLGFFDLDPVLEGEMKVGRVKPPIGGIVIALLVILILIILAIIVLRRRF